MSRLIPASLNVPAPYSQEEVEDPIVHVKLFTPCSSWTWLITEYNPEDKIAFGFAYDASFPEGAELGYVSLEELESVRLTFLPGSPAVQRDIHWRPMPLSEAKKRECPHARF